MATRDQGAAQASETGAATGVLVREGSYGTQVISVEPGGAEFIPLNERHGRPLQLFWTWTSPNMEFATIFVGVLAVAGFGLGFWEAALALVLGSAIGGMTQGILSLRGPKYGVPQMVLSRLGFGYWGNALARRAELGHGRDRLVRGEQRQRRAGAERADPHAAGAVPAHHRGGAGRGGVFRLQPGPPLRAVRLPDADHHLPHRGRGGAEQVPPGRRPPHHPRRVPARARRLVRVRGGLEPVRVGLHPVLQAGQQQGRDRLVVRDRAVRVLRAARDRRRGRRHRRSARTPRSPVPAA